MSTYNKSSTFYKISRVESHVKFGGPEEIKIINWTESRVQGGGLWYLLVPTSLSNISLLFHNIESLHILTFLCFRPFFSCLNDWVTKQG